MDVMNKIQLKILLNDFAQLPITSLSTPSNRVPKTCLLRIERNNNFLKFMQICFTNKIMWF